MGLSQQDADYVISAKMEEELSELPDEEAKEYLKQWVWQTRSFIANQINLCLLGLASFLAGEKEARAWTFTQGMTAPH